VDLHRCDADPYPDPTFHFDADPNPDPTPNFTFVGISEKIDFYSQQCQSSLFYLYQVALLSLLYTS
jgi:hypothetical protein